jgi:hypothetical protein
MASGRVETFLLPEGTNEFELFVNSDPEINKQIIQKIQRDEVLKSDARRRALRSGLINAPKLAK